MAKITRARGNVRLGVAAACLSLGAALAPLAHGADWADTSVGVRYGTKFAEPYDNNANGSRVDIKKTVLHIPHLDGQKYGSNFLNVALLFSDRKDPGDGIAGNSGAQEAYVVYRHLLDIGKVAG